ncbi:MAG: type II toxin-antitoxin system RelE/ParE family toxin [Bacteroidetes bacterium]|nr:type II toxin-antitoxin system RelE/ParE family toxin [Bacteroidota bacterium]
MVKISWTPLAQYDLKEIEAYIAQDSQAYAIITVEKIFDRTSILAKHPKSGRVVPEFENENIRELIEGNYRIVYFILNSKEVIISRVHHAARLLK